MKLIFALLLGLFVSGCVVEAYYPDRYYTGTVVFCDDYGCREVTAPYYYDSDGAVVYYDAYFGYWIGPHGYWVGGVYRPGFWVGYHGYYHSGWYHWRSPQHYYYYHPAPHYYHSAPYHGGHYHR